MNYSSGRIYHYKGSSDQGLTSNIGGTVSAGSIVMMAYDPATYRWWVGVNGTWRNSGDPANGTGYVFEGSATMFEDMSAITWGGWKSSANGITVTYNFGQDSTFGGQETAGGNADENGFGDFKYSPPTGFLALSSGNLSVSDDIDPAQTDSNYPGKQFGAAAWTGNAGTQTIQLGDSFKPDCVWLKNRGTANSWIALDSSRGYNKTLQLESTNAEGTNSYVGYGIESDFFDSTGIKANSGGSPGFNASGNNYITYGWRANGGTEATNNDGTGTSYVQANQAAGFSIVRYAGTGSALTIGHGLAQEPDITIVKDRDASVNWIVYTKLVDGSLDYFFLNTNASKGDSGLTGPNSSIWNFNSSSSYSNTSGRNYIMYNWHSVEGYSKFGSFEGNANNDGPYIYTGFRPRLLFIKNSDSSSPWGVYDTERPGFNDCDLAAWDESTAPDNNIGAYPLDILSNGFKLRTSNSTVNSSHTWVYGAWGDVPFKYNNTF